MKIRTLIIYMAVIGLVSALMVISAYSQEDITTVADSAFKQHMRGPVPFLHDQHNENAEIEECNACHHTDGKKESSDSSEGMECSECHSLENDNPIPLANRYHLQCKGCHQQEQAGPIMCGECHVKK